MKSEVLGRNAGGVIGVSAALLLAAALAHLATGSVRIPIAESIRILAGATPESEPWRRIVLEYRLPRVLTAIGAGAALATGGLLMQTLFRNPLAGPFVLGVNAGASLGVALVVLAGSALGSRLVTGGGLLAAADLRGDAAIATAAVLGSGAVLAIVLAVGNRVANALTLLVFGVLFSYAVNAVVSVLMFFSIPEEIQSYINWTFGSFAGVTTAQLPIFGSVVAAGLAGTVALLKPLNALLLGESYAQSMGVHVRAVRLAIIAITALLAGVTTAFCGPIGFVGVAVPHLARAVLKNADHRLLVPTSAILGSLVAVVADLAASLPGVGLSLPLNAVTALVGAPVVIWVIVRRGDFRGTFA
ncbi:MAG: iron chelate uptake ABC transporter family permease subunit [Spirochaetota bacterium]